MKNYIRTSIPPEYATTTGLKKDMYFFFDDADEWQVTQAYEFLVFEVNLKTDFGLQVHIDRPCKLTVPAREICRKRYAKRKRSTECCR